MYTTIAKIVKTRTTVTTMYVASLSAPENPSVNKIGLKLQYYRSRIRDVFCTQQLTPLGAKHISNHDYWSKKRGSDIRCRWPVLSPPLDPDATVAAVVVFSMLLLPVGGDGAVAGGVAGAGERSKERRTLFGQHFIVGPPKQKPATKPPAAPQACAVESAQTPGWPARFQIATASGEDACDATFQQCYHTGR